MRLSLRFLLPLFVVLSVVAYLIIPVVEKFTVKWFVKDLDLRSSFVANTISDSLIPLLESENRTKITSLFNKITKDERLYAIGVCNSSGAIIYKTATLPSDISCNSNDPGQVIKPKKGLSLHVGYNLLVGENFTGKLIVVHDMSFVDRRSYAAKKYIFYFLIALGALISFLTIVVAQLSWRGWIKGMRNLLKGEGLIKPIGVQTIQPELKPIVKDIKTLVRELESERKIRELSQITWTPQTLKEILGKELSGDEVLIVSNREPYIHNRKSNDEVEIQVPASGVVTALEPIMRACSGTWIAHGSGSADKSVVDKNDHVNVPPENPLYKIRRVWLTKEEEAGYYYGFSNEGLWPLCHIAHVRPTFRTEDWKQYVKVNQKFADAVVEEVKTESPVILIQDYHFALLPAMIKKKIPHAIIITFWHIPWPNPESFGICPWRESILEGLLGSSILGFHTRFHCNNFIDTVDRYLECRIDWESLMISYGGELTAINDYPISIEWPPRWLKDQKTVMECRIDIRDLNELSTDTLVGVGIDRLDYTKGIIERFNAIERLLELDPKWIGKFSFIQIAAPTRALIDQYKSFDDEVRLLAEKINKRFSPHRPIILKVQHHGPEKVFEYFRGADLCCVSSLHDGMNLVAKEFISSRDDEHGVLILSQFAGASKELPEALIVNPYNMDQCAAAFKVALEMPSEEQKARMRNMRSLLKEHNVYRWAGRMILDAAKIRQRNKFMEKIKHRDNIFPI